MTALIFGISGLISTVFICMLLDYTWINAIQTVTATNIAAFIALIALIGLQKIPLVKKLLIPDSLRSWLLFLLIYCSLTVLGAPHLIHIKHYLFLALPLIMSTGFCVPVFGFLQDQMLRYQQTKTLQNQMASTITKS